MGWTIGKTNGGLVRVSRPKELNYRSLKGSDMRPSDSTRSHLADSEGKHLAPVARTNHSSARSHRLKDFVAQIEVVEESRSCMHAGNPQDGVAEGGVYFHDQLPSPRAFAIWGAMSNPGRVTGIPSSQVPSTAVAGIAMRSA